MEKVNQPETGYFRPKTRGGIYEALKQNVKAEIPSYGWETSKVMIQSLMIMKKEEIKFKIYPSENAGYVIFEAE